MSRGRTDGHTESCADNRVAAAASMFEKSRVELERYGIAASKNGLSKRADHVLQEVRARLRQLQWLHARLVRLDAEVEAQARAELPADAPRQSVVKVLSRESSVAGSDTSELATFPFQPIDELSILLEAFYYSAHRVLDLLHDNRDHLPGMGRVNAAGVRDARNHLVEHPNKAGGVHFYSVAAGGPVGPQLRPIRWSEDPPGTKDQGLHANAREFEQALQRCLTRAIDALTTEPHHD
jgi:hypothetical protein